MKNLKTLFFALTGVLLLFGSGNAWGGTSITVASWGKVSLSANTAVNASDWQGKPLVTAPTMTSNKAMTTSGTNCYYGSSAGGAVITIAGLPTGFKITQVTFYTRASQQGTMTVSYSTDGSKYTDAGSASITKSEAQKTVNFSTTPSSVTHIKFTHSATSGSLYFGTVVITGEAASTKTAVSVAIADGQSSMGTVKLYDTDEKEVTGGSGEFNKDDVVTVEATKNNNYRFINWTLTAETDATWNTGSSATDYMAELKVGSKNVTATANFAQEYTISVTQNDENMGEGAFNTSPSTYSKAMIADEQAEIVATVLDDDAYEFVNWTVEPANAVTFANATAATTTITATAQAATIKANFQAKTTKYAINLTQPTGIATIATTPATEAAAADAVVTLTYSNIADHYTFQTWTVKNGDQNVTVTNPTQNNATFSMPAAAVTVSATFVEDDKYTITFSDAVHGTDCSSYTMANKYAGTQIVFNSIADKTPASPTGDCVNDHYHFVGWVESGVEPKENPSNVIAAGTTSINVTKTVTYKAVWAQEKTE